jgi:hypothetical protein
LRRELERLRGKVRSGIPYRELESLAAGLDRKHVKGRGKEHVWVSQTFPDLRPVSIPGHPRPVFESTAKKILYALEEDLERWEKLASLEEGEDTDNDEQSESEDS